MVISEDRNKLFCALPFESLFHSYVYVFDTDSFKLLDRIRAPLGTRAVAIDEERQVLFAGSAVTNLIELIDLKNKKTQKIYKAGNHYIKEIALDKKRKTFYISTRNFGLFKDHY